MKEEKFMLTESQLKKLAHAHKNNVDFTLTLSIYNKSPAGVPIPLTEAQYKLLMDGKNHRITISHAKLGGILPFLAPLLAAIPAIAGVAGVGAAGTTIAKNVYDMVKKSKEGSGAYIGRPCGSGVHLGKPRGMGVHLGKLRGSGVHIGKPRGMGVHLGKPRGMGVYLGYRK